MGEELKRITVEASNLKMVLLQNSNIDMLLYLAKYNPKVTTNDIVKRFGKGSIEGLNNLICFNLVKEDNKNLKLTEEGIFQVEGLLTLAV